MKPSSRTLRTLLATALLSLPAFITPAGARAESGVQARGRVIEESVIDRQTREISSQLRCVVCQGLSLQDSPSQLAQEMRSIVREKLEEGMTPDQVKAYFVERYGEWVMLKPEPKGFNLFVYIMPVLMLVGGAGFVFFNVRKWTAAKPEGASEAEELQLK